MKDCKGYETSYEFNKKLYKSCLHYNTRPVSESVDISLYQANLILQKERSRCCNVLMSSLQIPSDHIQIKVQVLSVKGVDYVILICAYQKSDIWLIVSAQNRCGYQELLENRMREYCQLFVHCLPFICSIVIQDFKMESKHCYHLLVTLPHWAVWFCGSCTIP